MVRAGRSLAAAVAVSLTSSATALADPPKAAAAPVAAAVPIPHVPVGISKVIARLDGSDEIGVASYDYHIHLIERMRGAGFDAVGAENLVFGKDESARARFLVGGTVREVACRETWDTLSCRIGVEWQVLDVASDRVVYKVMSRVAILDSSRKDRKLMAGPLLDKSFDALLKRGGFRQALTEETDDSDDDAAGPPATIARCARGATVMAGADDLLRRVVLIQTHNGFGSGFFVSPEGLILTAAHVARDLPLKVRTREGTDLEAVPVRVDSGHDVALLRTTQPLTGQRCMPLRLDPSPSGAEAFAVGAPASLDLAFSLTRGIVSGYPFVARRRLLQTDAPVNPGNSGGPIADATGAAMGVVSFKLVSAKVEGIAFAVPIPETLAALGLHVGDATDPGLLNETADLTPPAADASSVTDRADPVPSLDPEGDRRHAEAVNASRAQKRYREEHEDEGEATAKGEAESAEAPRSSPLRPVLLWGGTAVAAAGTIGVLVTYSQYKAADTTEASVGALRTWNTVWWVTAGVGAGAAVVSFVLRPPAAPPPSGVSLSSLGLTASGVTLRGGF